ncbi:MAG: TetR/AcrR family transcriptional regulator [Acetobacteraceae bacterium]
MNAVQDKSERRSQRGATTSRHQGLHDQLLAAAEKTIAADGLPALRARALAEAVGCSVGAIYNIFPDLDALILAVNGRTLSAIDLAMRSVVPDAEPAVHLVHLAETYLDYAATQRRRWIALFSHRMSDNRTAPPWYAEQRNAAFSHVEAPLAALRPDLPADERALLARTLFAAVHGMVVLGLDETLTPLKLPVLRDQVRIVVQAMARGLTAGRTD